MLNVAGTGSERKWLVTHVLVRMGSVRVVCSQAKKSSSQQHKFLYKEVFKKREPYYSHAMNTDRCEAVLTNMPVNNYCMQQKRRDILSEAI